MTKLITTPLGGAESLAIIKTRLQSITDGCFGTGAYAAAANWGGVRALLNPMLPAAIANREAVGSYIAKLNILNNPVARLVSAIFTGANDVLFDFTDPVGNYSDTGGTVQIVHDASLARSNSLVNGLNSQQATPGFRGKWLDSGGIGRWQPDGSDDLFAFTLPNAVTGTTVVIGTGGAYFETRDGALGTTVNVGFAASNNAKNGTYMGWGLLGTTGLLGDILAIGFKEGALSDDQKLHIARACRAFGGAGIITHGANLAPDPGLDTGTGWNTGTGWAIGGGVATKSASGSQGILRCNPGALVAGAWYRVEADLNITAAGTTRFALMTGATATVNGLPFANSNRRYGVYMQATAGCDGMGIYGNNVATLTADNIVFCQVSKGW